ncbi:MAG: hypothetical protein PF961_02850 [Planctomycetota bacterium]|jgi:hypothetical protein|nr:hypothetical protein [Planctomycetota bacterium]
MRLFAVLALLLTLVACNERPGPEVVEIRLLSSPGRVVYNGEEMGEAEAERELQYLATGNKNEVTQTATGVRIVIVSSQGANDHRARKMSQYCMSIGLNMVQFQTR